MTLCAEPPRDCQICARLTAYRRENAQSHPDWFNGPAPSFGDADARLLIVGLAPGRTGANRTGRPFTGDYAGDLLYGALLKAGLASGTYLADPGDGLSLRGVMITNAVRCAPPQNKPTPAEISACRPHLAARIACLPQLKAILALGAIAHDSVVRAHGLTPSQARFAHGSETRLRADLMLISSFHCSRYNTQTRRLTSLMFETVLERAKALAGLSR